MINSIKKYLNKTEVNKTIINTSNLKIDAFILCYNELNIIRHTLNHYSRFCNQITILDNQSNDGCLAVLKKEYPKVKVKSFNSNDEQRENLLTQIRNDSWKNSTADYVIVCDMDELLYHEKLEHFFYELAKHEPAMVSVIGYEMYSKKFPFNYDKSILSQVKYGCRNYRFDKSILFNPKKIKEINFDYGSHSCNPIFYKKQIKDNYLAEIKLLHYKYIGEEELIEKHLIYGKRLSAINLKNKWGIEYLEGKKHIQNMFNHAEKYSVKIIK